MEPADLTLPTYLKSVLKVFCPGTSGLDGSYSELWGHKCAPLWRMYLNQEGKARDLRANDARFLVYSGALLFYIPGSGQSYMIPKVMAAAEPLCLTKVTTEAGPSPFVVLLQQ